LRYLPLPLPLPFSHTVTYRPFTYVTFYRVVLPFGLFYVCSLPLFRCSIPAVVLFTRSTLPFALPFTAFRRSGVTLFYVVVRLPRCVRFLRLFTCNLPAVGCHVRYRSPPAVAVLPLRSTGFVVALITARYCVTAFVTDFHRYVTALRAVTVHRFAIVPPRLPPVAVALHYPFTPLPALRLFLPALPLRLRVSARYTHVLRWLLPPAFDAFCGY